ncbi:PRTRC system protein D [Zoogloea sp. LCSB751]|uniref:PRTRC system protein D n=1 Tax=Zoogloea sp. LCSB751 TaxID=1965277 RepID=UPI0009A47AE3|nr:PRTRC system protein D [Zoogloea sp. LCSB751]
MFDNVRALDVGYGNVKYVASRTQSTLTCKLFPSLAPRAVEMDLAGDFVRKRDTKRVVVNGIAYEVGPDVKLAQKGSEIGRMLQENYCLSEHYKALVYGGLLHMTRSHELEVLVLGLPLNTYLGYKDPLAKAFTGTHILDAEGRACTVKNVVVVPQPLGGLYDYAFGTRQLSVVKKSTSLVIDPGFCTLDWLVAEGTTPNDARSGARAHGGMSEVLKDVMEQVALDAECTIDELGGTERIDAALRDNLPIRVFGHALTVRTNADYIKLAQARAKDALQAMLERIGSIGDIDNIILVGGGSYVYIDVLHSYFPKHNIVVFPDSVFSNVRGFQLLGEIWLAKRGMH